MPSFKVLSQTISGRDNYEDPRDLFPGPDYATMNAAASIYLREKEKE
jgi:hypothetical protein